MSRTRQNFTDVVECAILGEDCLSIRPTIEKEILHYDILHAMHGRGYMKNLVFQGGTSLRLVYGSSRLSEDLDFSGGPEFSKGHMDGIADAVSGRLTERYGLSASVRSPKQHDLGGNVNVSAWQISVDTHPERRDLPKQRIKIDVASISARTREHRRLKLNYDVLPVSLSQMIIPVESPSEIMTDKVVSLAATDTHIRYRDIWDIDYIRNVLRISSPDVEMISGKAREYGILDFGERLDARMKSIPAIVSGDRFRNEMTRFIPARVLGETLDLPEFRESLSSSVVETLKMARDGMSRKAARGFDH